jgi:Zn-dependent protease
MECFIIVTVLWIFSVCIHEFGHAWIAYLGGDHTVKDKGYLTLNPLHYTDPLMSIALPVIFMMMGGIGLPGGAVYIERHLLRSKYWETAMSLAGPAMNVIMIMIIGLCFRLGLISTDPTHLASISLGFLMQLEISAVLFNLIPLPPLDGFQAIAPWMPEDARERFYAFSRYSLMILFFIFWRIDFLNHIFWTIVYAVSDLLGVPSELGWEGYQAFQFWKQSGF